MAKLPPADLHQRFLSPLSEKVLSHSEISDKPLVIDFEPPLPPKVRLYMFNATHPPGGRTLGEHKIQLIIPGQQRGERGSFDHSDGRIVLLAGYSQDSDVFILWDAGLYPEFAYSRNVQVNPETIYAAVAGNIGQQQRRVRGQGIETVITAPPRLLADAIALRMELARKRLTGE